MNPHNPHQPQFSTVPYGTTPPGGAAHNPSLRVFNNPYSAGNSPTHATFQQAAAYLDGNYDDDGDGQDDRGNDHDHDNDQGQGDPKRRRIARACDMCRKKKIKCDGKMPKCSHCQNYKTECIFTQVEKKRQPPKGAKYIEGLENRLARMEGLLKMSGLLGEDDGGKTDLGTLEKRLADRQAAGSSFASPISPHVAGDGSTSAHPTPPTGLTSPQSGGPLQDGQAQSSEDKAAEGLADQMCSLVTNNAGETRYIGSSSGFSIFSPKGIQWVNEKTGDSSFRDMISQAATDDRAWAVWKPEIFDDIFSRKIYKPLPPKPEALALLRDFFENFNCVFPLFHEPTFMHLVDKHYSLDPYEGSGWWASLNVALAISHRLRIMGEDDARKEDAKAWGYLKNALAVFSELTMRNNDLLSVQALLGMALFMQGTPNPQPGFFLVAAALRLAHSIGLHKRGSDFNLNEVESEQRKRVFWIGYLMDKDIGLRSGRPPIQDDDDMNVELPSENPPDNIGVVSIENGKSKVNLFRIQCVFAMIQSKVYKLLYSVKAARQTDGELLNTIGDLDQELEEWKDSIPIEFRPEHEIKMVGQSPLVLHIVVMHFAYYNCLTTIHRMSVHHGYWTSRLSNYAIAGLNARPLNPRVFMSAALCVNAARTSISLVKYIPSQDHACVWLLVYYPVSALVTLFANILQNPQDARARSDLKLMNSMTEFLQMLCNEDGNVHCRRMASICKEFERIARVVLDKAERDIKGRGKRKTRDSDSAGPPTQSASSDRRSASQPVQAQQTPNLSTSTLPAGRKTTASPSVRADGHMQHQPFHPSPMGQMSFSTSAQTSPFQATAMPPEPWMQTVPPGPENMFAQPDNRFPPTSFPQENFDMQGYGGGLGQIGGDLGGSFQQPFVPQDLWQMPMTLEWDWADFFGTGPGFDLNDPTQGGPHGGQ
ncbi:hypothetical protein D6C79_03960 [Aureobasidium pullulans]|nr:hypothetical protein D6C79_03960 [Aureobasidium pullulans]